jgi:O-antigen/teichoic acid export membrane protein
MIRGFNEDLITFWRNLKRSDSFSQNLAFTFSGNVLAILIGFAFTPILTRIYSPGAYGMFSLFIALSQNVGSIATLQFTRAFVIVEKEEAFRNLLVTTLLSSFVFSVVSGIVLLLFGDVVLDFFQSVSLKPFLILIPIAIFFNAFNDIIRSWNIRLKAFKRGSYVRMSSTLASRLSSVSLGFFTSGSVIGLLVGELVYKIIDSVFLITKGMRQALNFSGAHKPSAISETFTAFKNYPLYVLPSVWIGGFATQLPVYFLLMGFSSEVVGHYSLANRMLSIPALIIVNSLAPVFLQRITEHYRTSKDEIANLIAKLVNRLLLITLFPFLLLMLFSEWIFEFFLGDQWTLAGQLAFFLGVYYPFYILSGSMVSIFRVFERERLALFFNLIFIGVVAIVLWIGIQLGNVFITMALYSISSVVLYAVQTYLLLKIAGCKKFKTLILGVSLFLIIVALIVHVRSSELW